MAQGGKQKTENIFRTQTADCFSGGQSFNPSYITCAVQIFRVEETRKWYRQQQSFGFFFLIISIFPNLIQLFVSSWSDFAQEGATITDRLWNCTTTHIHAHNQFFYFFFTRFCLPVIPQDFPCLSSLCLSWFLIFLSLGTQHRRRCLRPSGLFNVLKVKSRAWWLCVLPVPYPD